MKNLLVRILILVPLLSNPEVISPKILSNNNKLVSNSDLTTKKIIFIYNASDNFLSVGFDFFHKIISPQTYQCSLCKITYGNVSMKDQWKEYIDGLNYDIEFLYMNNFSESHPDLKAVKAPSTFIYDGKEYYELINKEEFNAIPDLDSLIQLMNKRLIK
ncbi:MAG: hypothetical protein CMG59_00560 [Candidatus Marinimicrobia bacterium]|nr:hypothetical protein [Candidatus Neomarinimicrobiota bacterium]|tara:strand:+ start:77 stop:553 length:477 start_codon:yes stop_codon:yes gene_type:complete